MTTSTAPHPGGHAWEAVVLVRDRPRRPPRVARTLQLNATTADQARAEATRRLSGIRGVAGVMSVGALRPLLPGLPGTHRYEVVFAEWVDDGDAYRRDDVLTVRVWATDGASARSQAVQEAERNPRYRGAWRIRGARRIPAD